MTITPWQEYDCPVQQTDTDLFDDEMVCYGQTFHCHWCGGNHTAGFDVTINTYTADGEWVELPTNTQNLDELRSDVTEKPSLREAAQLALEALIEAEDAVRNGYEAANAMYAGYPTRQPRVDGLKTLWHQHVKAIEALAAALAVPDPGIQGAKE